jgi:hypothetical protein
MKAYVVVPFGINRSKHGNYLFLGEVQVIMLTEEEAQKIANRVLEEARKDFFGEEYIKNPKKFARKHQSDWCEFDEEFEVRVLEVEIPESK